MNSVCGSLSRRSERNLGDCPSARLVVTLSPADEGVTLQMTPSNRLNPGDGESPFSGAWPFAEGDPFAAYLAPRGHLQDLLDSLKGRVRGLHGRLVLASGPATDVPWAQNTWRNPVRLPVESITRAAALLRSMQRNWAAYSPAFRGRTTLIEEKLPGVSRKPVVFPSPLPKAPMGSFTLLDESTMLVASDCSSPYAHGELFFDEDPINPPSRAYLKLWEALTLAEVLPQAGDRCADLGSAPGGWTWVLQQLGADVLSVDKADLDTSVEALPRVTHLRESAFGLDPVRLGPLEWLTSDVICYPSRLLTLVQRFIASGTVRNFVCTVKFQGETDHASAAQFESIPGSRLVHLSHNKHELTWMRFHEK